MSGKDVNTRFGSYTLNDGEHIVEFEDKSGLSLLLDYNEGLAGKKMMIKIGISEKGKIRGGVHMVSDVRTNKEGYTLLDPQTEGKKYTNFNLDEEDSVSFDEDSKRFIHDKDEFSLSQFIAILKHNHLYNHDWLSPVYKKLSEIILRCIFWLGDANYLKDVDVGSVIGSFGFNAKRSGEIRIEPFFKYFYISKNLMFLCLLLIFSILILLENFCIFDIGTIGSSSWLWVITAFLFFFLLEKLSKYIQVLLDELFQNKNNVLKRLNNIYYGLGGERFNLIFDKSRIFSIFYLL